VVVDVVVVDLFVFDSSFFSVLNGLQLMTIGEVGVVSGRHYIVFVISLGSQKLVLGCGFKLMGSGPMVYGCVVMHFVLVYCCHGSSPIDWQKKISLPRTGCPTRI
jgi:hypothetical protein